MKLNLRSILISAGLLAAASLYPAYAVINSTVAVCNPTATTQCLKPDASGALPVTGTFNANTTALANTVAPTYTDGTTNPLSADLNGALRVTGSISANSTATASASAPTYTAGPQPFSQDLSGNLRTTLTSAIPTGANTIGNVGLNASSNIIGNVRIDQTTPGTTNGVQVNAALPTGTNNIGSIGNGAAGTPADGLTNASSVVNVRDNGAADRLAYRGFPFDFNGTSWDRKRGDVNGSWTQGNVASGATDAGNPVKIGGVYNSTLPTFTTGQRGDFQIGSRGGLSVYTIGGSSGADGASNTIGKMLDSTSSSLALTTANTYFNGTTWDRVRGDANGGAWVQPSTNSGTSNFSLIAAATTNSTNVKNAPGVLTEITVYNNATAMAYLKLYNSASAPTCGSGTPVGRYLIPGGSNGAGSNVTLSLGKAFSTGISFCITGAIGDADTTAVAANQYIVNMTYK